MVLGRGEALTEGWKGVIGIDGGGEVALARFAMTEVLEGGGGAWAVGEDDVRGGAGVEVGGVNIGSEGELDSDSDGDGVLNSTGRT